MSGFEPHAPGEIRPAPHRAEWLLPLLLAYPAAVQLIQLPFLRGLGPESRMTGKPLILAALISQLAMLLIALAVPSVKPEREGRGTGGRFYAEAVWIAVCAQAGFTGLDQLLPALPGAPALPADAPLSDALILAAIAVLLPAICEELLFRGRLLPLLEETLSLPGASLLSALIFSLMHRDPRGFLAQMTLGLCLNSLARRSGSLLPGMVCHLAFNLTAVLLSILKTRTGLGNPFALILFLVPVLIHLRARRPDPAPRPPAAKRARLVWCALIILSNGAVMALMLTGAIA